MQKTQRNQRHLTRANEAQTPAMVSTQPEVRNFNRVPKKIWAKWSRNAQKTFNSTFGFIKDNQLILNHPDATLMSTEHYRTICWNAAFVAAYAVDKDYWGPTGDEKARTRGMVDAINAIEPVPMHITGINTRTGERKVR